MAPTIRYTAIPATLWNTDSPFVLLRPPSQWLYIRLWTSEARDSAGFIPYQPGLWAKSGDGDNRATVEHAVKDLLAGEWVLVDLHAEQAWLPHYFGEDPFNSPNQYVSALNRIRTCQSGLLRDAAWDEVQRLGLPQVKVRDPEKRADTEKRIQRAYDDLKLQMHTKTEAPSKGLGRTYEAPSKLPNVNAHVGAGAGETPDDDGEPWFCSVTGCSGEAGDDGRCAECVRGDRR